ncbi:MAG TPA: NAD-dependent epimerase/dehydratase family protein [Polyangiaceae bacterium LLY-WYZ-15_(1-7)]|nr:oxidoreductase [Myxococcales bacterium]MAT25145.1 oxidoreductase [Sandaracinus sp.]HJL05385.1 NAD-dependent epimerase/dehydratase family protein [Polyangiaceae bacterium LLY-WYZ-15_(1-7)]MBJ70496.1 oxidoreductase [Sandaracinus sp.]HJL09684.1 NAD-dependent epimerase/dehydratase family protein [Polyangiaceae bacterium LLY-WYZ-15_(1-7)]
MSEPKPIRIGVLGAGYIATWHADAIQATPGAELTAICDTSADAASGMAEAYGAEAFTSVEDLVAAGVCDAVHVLTPPNTHKALTIQCLEAGLHTLVEKPVALSADDTREMVAAAEKAGRVFAAGHNFLGLPSYGRLKTLRDQGELGRIVEARINWCLPLGPLRAGPYGIWLLREPQNLILELGPHPFAFAVDLFGPLEINALDLGQPVELEGGGIRHQSWRILARAGAVDVTFTLSMAETIDDRSVTLRGSSGMARLDYAADTLVTTKDNTADLVVNPFLKEAGLAIDHLREAFVNVTRQASSLNQKSPYGLSFRGSTAAFVDAVRRGGPVDPRFSGESAITVMQAIDDTIAKMPKIDAPPVAKGKPKPTVMVIGGTGFIGRNLTRTLVSRGYDVRVASRGKRGPFDDIADHVEVAQVSLYDKDSLVKAMEGIDTVFNLAKSMDKTWEAALKNDVGTAVRVAEACMEAGVKRLIYTGTIASYDMSDPKQVITEETDFGDIENRNLYARSKAECERRQMAMYREVGLPLVIARPGIVVGAGGPLQHWGIGRWHGAGAVRLWGDGTHNLPFVLADDVSDGLIRMMEQDEAVGKSFNLIGEPMLSGRDYFDAIHDRLGARIQVSSSSLEALWLSDGVKFGLKRYALRRKGVVRPSLADWRSRAHLSQFDNSYPKQVLGWKPEADREKFLTAAIDQAGLFGL